MNFERACYGCFREKSTAVCPYCGYDPLISEPPALALPTGTILNGRYMTGAVLGMGGFGITYLGYDITLDIKVAIKEYLPGGMATRDTDHYTMSLISSRDEARYRSGEERFLDEARILAKLANTPNIVSVQNYFRENNTAYFVMDYIEGMSLKAYLQDQGGSIPFAQAAAILLPIMEALSQVHAQGLLHRDISPDNIYITAEGQSKLLDFGAARFALGGGKSISIILKHGYAPEEQYLSRGNQGPWTDVYAMGATLYHCVTGAMPPDSIERLSSDVLKRPSALGVRLPPYAEEALMRALAVKAENRFPNMAALIDALAGKSAVRQGVSSTVAMNAGTLRAEKKAGRVQAFFKKLKSDKKLLGLAIGGTLAALALIVLLPLALLRDEKPAQSSETGPTDAQTLPPQSPRLPQSSPLPGSSAPIRSHPPTDMQMRTYSHAGLSLLLQAPNDMLEQANELGLMLERTSYTTIIFGFGYFSGQTMYTLQDFERHRDAIIANEMAGLELGTYSITGGEYVRLNRYDAYRVDLQFGAEENISFQTYAVTPAQGLGLYLIHVAQKLDDPDLERHQQENEELLQSISFTGPPNTGLTLYNSQYMDVRFVYQNDLLAGGMMEYPAKDGTVQLISLYVLERTDICILLQYASGYADSVEEAFASNDKLVLNNDENAKIGKLYTRAFGQQEYAIKEYEMEGADTGDIFYALHAVTEIKGTLYSLDVWYTEENAESMLAQAYSILTTLSAKP